MFVTETVRSGTWSLLVRNVYDYSMDNPSLVVRFIRFKTTVRVNILLRTTSVLLQRCLVMCDCSTRYEHRIISAKNFCERCAFHVDDFLALKTLELSFWKNITRPCHIKNSFIPAAPLRRQGCLQIFGYVIFTSKLLFLVFTLKKFWHTPNWSLNISLYRFTELFFFKDLYTMATAIQPSQGIHVVGEWHYTGKSVLRQTTNILVAYACPPPLPTFFSKQFS